MARSFLSVLFVWFLILHQNTRAQTVSIGAITNPTTRIGREQKVAIQLAIEKFSPETLLAGGLDLNTTDLSPVYSYGMCCFKAYISWNKFIIFFIIWLRFCSPHTHTRKKEEEEEMLSIFISNGTLFVL
jgi:hypothetical protein